MGRRTLPAWIAAVSLLLLPACHQPPPPPDDSVQEVRARLVGTWLREYELDGSRVRRILVLEPDGRFREMSRTIGAAEPDASHQHEGQWTYDGTNLKRRYTLLDGKQPGAPAFPYAAFQLRFDSRHEFTGIDNVRRRELRYHRVSDGTLP